MHFRPRALPIFDRRTQTQIVDQITGRGFPIERADKILAEMRSVYYELKPLFQDKGQHSGEAKNKKNWLKRVQRAATGLFDGKAQPRELLETLARATNYELLLLRPLFTCPIDRRVRRRDPGHCPTCGGALEASMELDPEFINELCRALERYPDKRYKWRKLVRAIGAQAAAEQRRDAKKGRRNDPLLKMLVDRLIRIFERHTVVKTTRIAKFFDYRDCKGKYGGQCFDYVCWALGLYGLHLRENSVGTYFELRFRGRSGFRDKSI